ncbi:PAS domain S-box protein [Halorubrum laminariae]|uniref:histidine kinase n=1 Tax=Halorubrum laminariae TaxID=1433523 RepID=A0ABD6C462_9EURY|nr:PAS domain S-box protein [Halorubrum laminariae]
MSVAQATIRVLHVDDHREFADLTATSLKREDDCFSVDTAPNADVALDKLADGQFDCVVSDYDMPRQNGLELLDAVRDQYPDLPFILFTGKGSEEVASDAISAGVTDYLQKEPGAEQYTVLANRIRNAVDRSRARAEQQRQLDAIETAREGISILNENRRFIYANQAYADLYGYSSDELIGESWELLYRNEDREKIRTEILPTVDSEGYWSGETIGLRADGETFIEDHALALTDSDELICTVRDATTETEQAQELEEARARLEALFEHSPDMINIHDSDGIICDVNQRFCEELGYDESEISGEGVWTVDPNIDPEDLRARLAATETGERFRAETQFQRHDGSTIPVEVHVVRLDLADNDRFVVLSRDITEQKAREQELAQLTERYQAFIEHSSDILSVVDETGEMQFMSPAAEHLFGYSPGDLEGENAFDYFHPDDRKRVSKAFYEMIEQSGSVTERVEYRFRHADGSWMWVETIGSNETGTSIDGYVLTTRDISQQKEREQQLQALHGTAYELLAADSREEIAAIGVEAARDIIGLDANVCNLYDADRDLLVPVSSTSEADDLIGDPPAFSQGDSIAWRVFEHGEAQAIDDIRTDPDVYNAETPIRSELHLPLDDHGILVAGSPTESAFDEEDLVLGKLLARGITVALDTLKQTEQLQNREAELAQQNERLEQFASFVSHDLQNPLAVAEGYLELAREDCESDHLDTVAETHDRMRALIDDLLTLARDTDPVGNQTSVSLNDLSMESWDHINTEHATLENRIAKHIQADRSQLKRLLVNLFQNAVEHGGDDVTVTVGSLPDGFYVEDDGSGIPADEQADVFESGYSTTTDGTGLGLAIVSEVVEAHDWNIHVTEGSNGGARFEITDDQLGG